MDLNYNRNQPFSPQNNMNQWAPSLPDQIPFHQPPVNRQLIPENSDQMPLSPLNLHQYITPLSLYPELMEIDSLIHSEVTPSLSEKNNTSEYLQKRCEDKATFDLMEQQFKSYQIKRQLLPQNVMEVEAEVALEISPENAKRNRDFPFKEPQTKKIKQTGIGSTKENKINFLLRFYKKAKYRHTSDDMSTHLNSLSDLALDNIFDTLNKNLIVSITDHCNRVGIFLDYIYDYKFEPFITEMIRKYKSLDRAITPTDINRIIESRKEKNQSRPIQFEAKIMDNQRKFCPLLTISGEEILQIFSKQKNYQYITNLIINAQTLKINYSLNELRNPFPHLKELKLNDSRYVLESKDVDFIRTLESISLRVSNLKKWTHCLTGPKSLEDFGDFNVSTCTNLTHLTLYETNHLSRDALSSLTNLKSLMILKDTDDITIPKNLTHLTSLISFNDTPISVPTRDIFDIDILSRLRKLVINMSSLPHSVLITQLTNLTHLQIRGIKDQEQSFISILTNLTYLNLDGTVCMKHLKYCRHLTSLDVLKSNINGTIFHHLGNLSIFNGHHLKSLEFLFDSRMQSSSELYTSFTNLTSLSIMQKFEFNKKTINWIKSLNKLIHLNLYEKIQHPVFSHLTNLTSLRGCSLGLEGHIKNLTNLRQLNISKEVKGSDLFLIVGEMIKNNKNLVFEYKNKLF